MRKYYLRTYYLCSEKLYQIFKNSILAKTPLMKNFSFGGSNTSKIIFSIYSQIIFIYLKPLKLNNINTFHYFCEIIVVQMLKPLILKIV